ncbi:MAG: ATP-binding protein [Bacteroidales bacterium]|nr:ATP-binding protein [Bacteroidales bacterium]
MNPFKYGTVVDKPYFFNREKELARIRDVLNSPNHLTIISPRRYGKTSLIRRALSGRKERHIFMDMQVILTPEDLAAQLLKRVYRISPFSRIKNMVRSFRVVPSLVLNPSTGEIDVNFKADDKSSSYPLEDVLNMIEKLGSENKRIVVALDEFQEIFRIDKTLDRLLRSIMQNHKNINYILAGSSESMMREIFEDKKSPFYHFASVMTLKGLPEKEFRGFLTERFKDISKHSKELSSQILQVTGCQPYYTQQLASFTWDSLKREGYTENIISKAVEEILQNNDNNYERLWQGFNRTEMKVLTGMAASDIEPLSKEFSSVFNAGPSSTVYSSIQKLMQKGIIVKASGSYTIDDPFLKKWIVMRRER